VLAHFLVCSVCRSLALDWRIVGDFGALRSRQQSWGGACSGALPDPTDDAPADASPDGFSVHSLPMYLMPVQVLFLLNHAPTAKLLRIVDASSIAALRRGTTEAAASVSVQAAAAAASPSAPVPASSSSLAQTLKAERIAAFQECMTAVTRANALKRKHQHVGSNSAGGDPAESEIAEQNDAKKRKREPEASTSPTAATNAASSSSLAKSAIPLNLPDACAGSSLQLAIDTFPCPPDALATLHTGHPSASILALHWTAVQSSVLISNRLGQLELRNKLTHSSAENAVADWIDMRRLVYANACEAIGVRLHGEDCPVSSASSSRSLLVPYSASSPPVHSLLSQLCVFVSLWSRGYVVLAGAHFSADLVAYEDLPSRVHSSFLVKIQPTVGDDDDGDDADEGGFSMLLLSGLGRIASGINKAVMLVQPRLQPHADTRTAANAVFGEACVSRFDARLRRYLHAQLDFTTFHWSPTASLANASFSHEHLRKAPLELVPIA
jgi:tRNA splicing endonuclease